MIRIAAVLLVSLPFPSLLSSAPSATDTPPAADAQIAAALQAAPEGQRAGATVLGYDADHALVSLREGDNDLICLADDPSDDTFSVACYHRSLEPYMARGRELRAQGVSGMERNRRRWKEIEEGTLAMPEQPAILYVLTGDSYDAESGVVDQPYLRYVLYTPFATGDDTGLPTEAVQGAPWLMFEGTAGAHIMISPPRD